MERGGGSREQIQRMLAAVRKYLDGIDKASRDRLNIDDKFLDGLSDGEVITMYNVVGLAKKFGATGDFSVQYVSRAIKHYEKDADFAKLELNYVLQHKPAMAGVNPAQPLPPSTADMVDNLARLALSLGLARIDPSAICAALILLSERHKQDLAELEETKADIQAVESLRLRLEQGYADAQQTFDDSGRKELTTSIQASRKQIEDCEHAMETLRGRAPAQEPRVDELKLEALSSEITSLIAKHSILAAEVDELEKVPPNLEQARAAADKAEQELRALRKTLAEKMPSYN